MAEFISEAHTKIDERHVNVQGGGMIVNEMHTTDIVRPDEEDEKYKQEELIDAL